MKNLIITLILPGLLCACTGKEKSTDAGAESLLSQSQAMLDAGNPQGALALLDSLNRAYPAETDVLRRGLAMRPIAMEKLSEQGIMHCDSAISAAKAEIESMRSRMRWVQDKGMIEGYWVDKAAYNPDFFNNTGIQARVTDIGQFYIVSSVNPGAGHTSISVSADGSSASTPAVAYDGESNYRIGTGEVITFSPEQSDTIGKFVASLPAQAAATLSFNGKGRKTVKLNSSQLEAIANAYHLSAAMASGRDNDIERQRLERQLELARKQQARIDSTAQTSRE